MEKERALYIVVFPWLAMGHLIPFLRLSKYLAKNGHRVSFVSTPKNIRRITRTPSNLSPLIEFVTFPLPNIDGLPDDAESSADVPYDKQPLLKMAFDSLESPLCQFLQESAPDWVIYDYASHWLPPLASELGISRAFFSLFSASCLSYIGPPSQLIDGSGSRTTAEDLTVVPKWMPDGSDMVYRLHEVSKYADMATGNQSGTPDDVRFMMTVDGSDVVAVRSSVDLESDWFDLLMNLYGKPVVPVGFLPPAMEDDDDEGMDDKIQEWLDKQKPNSVIYVALGTEASLNREELTELALGLELSQLPFFWVLRTPTWSTQREFEMLPTGFIERVKNRAILYEGWAPQVKILSHESVGGFLTHCGWNSVIEGLGFGRFLILFPVLNEQGLNARLLQGKKLGVEIERDAKDGRFTHDSVAETVKMAMAGESGEALRARVREMSALFGDRHQNGHQLHNFVNLLKEQRLSQKPIKFFQCTDDHF